MKKLNELLQQQLYLMCATGKLFRSEITGEKLWSLYLSSFSKEHDPKFRDPKSSVHNCNQCNNFIRRYGNIVAINEAGRLMTLFDIICDEEYQASMDNMSIVIASSNIEEVFFETVTELNSLPYEKNIKKTQDEFRLGVELNYKVYTEAEAWEYAGTVNPGQTFTFHHISLKLPSAFVDKTGNSVESIMANYRSAKEVFKRGMDDITLSTLDLVIELINQGSLLDGTTHLEKIVLFKKLKVEYDTIDISIKDAWCWKTSYNLHIAKFRNELIGKLCTELSEGENLNKACNSWNKRVDPANYMKAASPITESQKKNAQAFVEENGYVESFNRRFAVIEDIKAEEIKHLNGGDGSIKSVSMFDNIKTKPSIHKRNKFEGVEEVSIEKFMETILPTCTSVEAYLENKHDMNMVTLTTSVDQNCKSLFKWTNPYSWTFNGNLAGKSQIKQAVKSQGGKTDGVLRFSIMWSEGNSNDNSDLDAHCNESNGSHIYFSNRRSHVTDGNLDIDITNPKHHKELGNEVVENITYPSLDKMVDGVYDFCVNQYYSNQSGGFRAEIEFNGELHEYTYTAPVVSNVIVASVELRNGVFTIKHVLPSTSSSKTVYGLDTKQFHKVNLMCLSPNHWGDNNVGNKHYFFMLEGCKTDLPLRSFHNENLNAELSEHRKVLDVLGSTCMIEPTDNQLSGLGFNSTVRDSVILKLGGTFKRTIKVNF